MELLWASDAPQTVSDVHAVLTTERELAYTTVMTVLDRLSKKGQVDRELVARAWHYRPHSSRAVVVADELMGLVDGLPTEVRTEALRRFGAALNDAERAALAEGGSLSVS